MWQKQFPVNSVYVLMQVQMQQLLLPDMEQLGGVI